MTDEQLGNMSLEEMDKIANKSPQLRDYKVSEDTKKLMKIAQQKRRKREKDNERTEQG